MNFSVMNFKKKLFWAGLFSFSALGVSAQNTVYSWTNLPEIQQPVFKKDTTNILTLGAKADGVTLNTKAINEAIEKVSKKGGGVVLVPAGLWLTGPIVMKSNVNLHLKESATLLFTPDKSQYALTEGVYEGKTAARNQSPVSGSNLENIAITGKGVLDGNGDVWRAVNKGQLTESQWKEKVASGGVLKDDGMVWYPSEQFKTASVTGKSMLITPGKTPKDFADMKDFLRPNLVVFTNCKKILLEGVTFQNSPAWCLHPLMCQDLTLRNVRVKNPEYAHNGDGMDIESCKNFLIEGCVLDVGDDAICIKSGKDEEGRKRGIPSAEGIIRGNTVYNGHGGVVIGSEMSGGAKDIFIENCTFMGTAKGLRFKSTRGRGGVVERIYARNIFMKDIDQEAIFFDMFYFVKFATDGSRNDAPQVNEGTPIFRNMVFDHINCNGAQVGIFIRGLSEMKVHNITISNSWLVSDSGVELTDAANITLRNVHLVAHKQLPLLSATNSNNLIFDQIRYNPGLPVLLVIDGKQSEKIRLINTSLKSAAKILELRNGATAKTVSYK